MCKEKRKITLKGEKKAKKKIDTKSQESKTILKSKKKHTEEMPFTIYVY